MRSPIEMMIDKACGFDAGAPAQGKPLVMLKCPKCGRYQHYSKDDTDPDGTVKIELTCPKCWVAGSFEEPIYFDRLGKQILPNEQPPK